MSNCEICIYAILHCCKYCPFDTNGYWQKLHFAKYIFLGKKLTVLIQHTLLLTWVWWQPVWQWNLTTVFWLARFYSMISFWLLLFPVSLWLQYPNVIKTATNVCLIFICITRWSFPRKCTVMLLLLFDHITDKGGIFYILSWVNLI